MIPGALGTSYDDTMLRQRAIAALNQRNWERIQQASEQGTPWAGSLEREDPNLGMFNTLAQGMEEAAAGKQARLSKPALRGLMGAM